MTKRRSSRRRRLFRLLHRARTDQTARFVAWWKAVRLNRRAVRVEVLVADPKQRKSLEHNIHWVLRRLRWSPAPQPPGRVGVLVQHSVSSNRPLAGCSIVGETADGERFVLIRVATHVNGRAVPIDEMLAVLSDLWINIGVEQLDRPSVLTPIEPGPTGDDSSFANRLPPDPLGPRTNGQQASGMHPST
jgi:hypothetical protein